MKCCLYCTEINQSSPKLTKTLFYGGFPCCCKGLPVVFQDVFLHFHDLLRSLCSAQQCTCPPVHPWSYLPSLAIYFIGCNFFNPFLIAFCNTCLYPLNHPLSTPTIYATFMCLYSSTVGIFSFNDFLLILLSILFSVLFNRNICSVVTA